MQYKSDNSLPPDKLLYSHQKALDETVALGAIPRRLFRVLYPIRVMNIHGRQRVSTDMEEIQWFIERAIHQANLTTVEDLEFFLGLDARYIWSMISFLEKIGHLITTGGKLKLSSLGEESVAHRISYQERETQFKLYFDAFGNRPLRQEHYRMRFYETPPENPGYWIFPPWFRRWDPESLTRLSQRNDRSRYGLLDEIKSISPAVEDRILYMPVYIVERAVEMDEKSDLPDYLVFNTLPGYRDIELEQSINQDPVVWDWLGVTGADLQDVLVKRLNGFGLTPEQYRIKEDPTWGVEVFLDPSTISGEDGMYSRNAASQKITFKHIGRYLLAADWCVLLTSEDHAVRFEAGIQDCLEKLEHSHSDPSMDDINRSIALINRRLTLDPGITINTLVDEANRRGMNRAINRLERFG